MMPFEDTQIQLIDTPAWSEEFSVDWLPELVRRADACVLLADLAEAGSPNAVAYILDSLEARDVVLVHRVPDEREGFEVCIPALLVGNKVEEEGSADVMRELQNRFGDRFPTCAISLKPQSGLDELKRALFDVMYIIRVYTKEPGQEPDLHEPFVLPARSTVRDLAAKIHKDFLETFRYGRLWGASGKFQGQRVGEEHVLSDRDIVELHIR